MQETVRFAVDAKLLRELGARLVGRPHIAMAELIKNSYDADATHVSIMINHNQIVVADDGHGMTYEEFSARWMRIGTSQKETERVSRRFKRPLTGSKGVGRLSVQILADQLLLQSITEQDPERPFAARVDWKAAIQAKELTRAKATVEVGEPIEVKLPNRSSHGTRIVLTELQQTWDSRALRDLAREIWPLQPPFKADASRDERSGFTVELITGNADQERGFSEQMDAVLSLWTARLVGRTLDAGAREPRDVVTIKRPKTTETDQGSASDSMIEASDLGLEAADIHASTSADAPGWPRTFQLAIEFGDEEREIVNYRLDDCSLDRVRFQIRVFNLKNRQPSGINVSEARAYLRRFGGIHVYDAGFHLPYYGPDTDWLHIEMDHSHRLSQSSLLPDELTRGSDVANPLQYLPTNSRLFGQVQVDTQREAHHAAPIGPSALRESLSIQITRDRLRDNQAYRSLVQIVRFAIDLYAIREAQRALERKLRRVSPTGDPGAIADTADRRIGRTIQERAELVRDLLEESAAVLPTSTRVVLGSEISQIIEAAADEQERSQVQIGLLGALATAGITGLAQEHELAKQNALLRGLAQRLRASDLSQHDIHDIADSIDVVLERASATRRLFGHLLDERSRTVTGTFVAREVARSVADQVRPLMRNTPIDVSGVPPAMLLPKAGYVEWVAVLQNIYINAVNAMLDSPVQAITVDAGIDGPYAWLRVQDTGSGVDLPTADNLFKPFERRTEISPEREALGLGGTGLGLTIVRMIADQIGVQVQFEEPSEGYATAFVMSWRTQ